MRRAWGLLLAAVLPLWHDPALLAAHGDKIVQVWCTGLLLPLLSSDSVARTAHLHHHGCGQMSAR